MVIFAWNSSIWFGTTHVVSKDFWIGVWSPDGKWIAVKANRDRRLFLLDARDFSKRRSLGNTSSSDPEWSPDSRYLLLWKYSLFKCGFFLDIEPPATLEVLDVKTGHRSTIHSSGCQLSFGSTGWLSTDIAK
jgi:WD40 repeat protein